MIAVMLQDAVGLIINPLVHWLAVANGRGLVGPTGFDLEIHAEFVRRLERRLRRTIGMKAQQIQSMGFRNADDAFPLANIGRRMAGPGENAAFERAAKKCFATVDCELRAVGGDFAQTKADVIRASRA